MSTSRLVAALPRATDAVCRAMLPLVSSGGVYTFSEQAVALSYRKIPELKLCEVRIEQSV